MMYKVPMNVRRGDFGTRCESPLPASLSAGSEYPERYLAVAS